MDVALVTLCSHVYVSITIYRPTCSFQMFDVKRPLVWLYFTAIVWTPGVSITEFMCSQVEVRLKPKCLPGLQRTCWSLLHWKKSGHGSFDLSPFHTLKHGVTKRLHRGRIPLRAVIFAVAAPPQREGSILALCFDCRYLHRLHLRSCTKRCLNIILIISFLSFQRPSFLCQYKVCALIL